MDDTYEVLVVEHIKAEPAAPGVEEVPITRALGSVEFLATPGQPDGSSLVFSNQPVNPGNREYATELLGYLRSGSWVPLFINVLHCVCIGVTVGSAADSAFYGERKLSYRYPVSGQLWHITMCQILAITTFVILEHLVIAPNHGNRNTPCFNRMQQNWKHWSSLYIFGVTFGFMSHFHAREKGQAAEAMQELTNNCQMISPGIIRCCYNFGQYPGTFDDLYAYAEQHGRAGSAQHLKDWCHIDSAKMLRCCKNVNMGTEIAQKMVQKLARMLGHEKEGEAQ